jgi:cyanophycin synthetase
VTYEIISKETEDTPNFAEEGSFITALSDVVTNAIEIQNFDKENEHGSV